LGDDGNGIVDGLFIFVVNGLAKGTEKRIHVRDEDMLNIGLKPVKLLNHAQKPPGLLPAEQHLCRMSGMWCLGLLHCRQE